MFSRKIKEHSNSYSCLYEDSFDSKRVNMCCHEDKGMGWSGW